MKKLIICILLLVIIVQYHYNRVDQSQANPGERPQTTIEQVYELTKKLDTVVGYIYQQQSYEVYLKDWRNHTDPRGG